MRMKQNHFTNASNYDEAVKTVEQRHKVALEAQAVHFEKHFHREECDEEHVRVLCASKREIESCCFGKATNQL